MAWAAAAAVILLLASADAVYSLQNSMLESVLVIGSEQGSSSKRKLMQQMSGEPEPLMKWLVDKHNELRYRHGVQLLTWDWSLAWNAYNYVVGCPKGHSGQQGIGENLAWGHNDFNHAMRDWYDEIQFYNFNAPGFAENTGHFTQMVWRDVSKIGCAANLRCSFRTWICQFTPAGNLVNYGGSVDHNLWTTNAPAPSAKFITGTKPDGSPSYMLYDPNGESTRGLPQPRYGELKNFGYVPKPGQVVVMTNWQKFIPADVITKYLPPAVLEQYLKKEILELLKPEPAAVPKPGQPIHMEPQRAVVGWQQFLPSSVIKQYVPAPTLARFVPDGTVLATEKDNGHSAPVNATTVLPADVPAGADVTSGSAAGAAVSKPRAAPGEPPSFIAAAAQLVPSDSDIFSPPMKEDYEKGHRTAAPNTKGKGAQSSGTDNSRNFHPSRQLKAVSNEVFQDSAFPEQDQSRTFRGTAPVKEQGAVFFREEPALASAAQAHTTVRKLHNAEAAVQAFVAAKQQQEKAAKVAAAVAAGTAPKRAGVTEQGVLGDLFGGLGNQVRREDRGRGQAGNAQEALQPVSLQQPSYPVVNPVPVYPAGHDPRYPPVGHVPAQQPPSYYVQQPYPPQQQPHYQQPPMTGAPSQFAQQPQQVGQAAGPYQPSYQQTAQVPMPAAPTGSVAQQAAAGPQLPAGMQDVLDAHNFYRAKHQAPAAAWDEQLAASAAGVASQCPNSPSNTQGIGENLAWGFRDGGLAVDEWYKEGKQYDFSNPGFAMTSGHFSQIVWQDTQRIGCALVPTCSMPTFICHYYPPGNVMGADWSVHVKAALPGTAGPRPRQQAAAVPPPGYSYQPQQPVAAVPYPLYRGQPQTQQVQYQPAAAVPYPIQQPQQVPAVYAVPKPAEQQQQQQQRWVAQQKQQQQPVAAVLKPGSGEQQQQQQQQQASHIVTYPPYQTYQPYPVAAVPKPHQQFAPVVGSSGSTGRSGVTKDDVNFRNGPGAGPFSAPAIASVAAGASGAQSAEVRLVLAATTKPFSAPAFLTPLAEAVPKPETSLTLAQDRSALSPAISSRGKLPSSAPVQIQTNPEDLPLGVVGYNRQAVDRPPLPIAAVDKPPFPVAAARAFWPHVKRPVSSSGAPFSLSAPMQPAAAAVLSAELQLALDRHNEYRASHQVPFLSWDDTIASSAQGWAAGCPDGHSGTRGVGENMAWGYGSLADAVDAWYNEVKLYDFSNPGWHTATGHFTALVWKSTTKLGCAINSACSWPTYVCQYGPPGNVIGLDWSEEVKPKSEIPATPAKPLINTPIDAPTEQEPKTPTELNEPSDLTPAPKEPNPSTPVPANPSEPKAEPTKPSQPVAIPAKPSPEPAIPKAAPHKKPARKAANKGVPLTKEQKTALHRHNLYRAKHNAPALTWDPKIAAVAQSWADSCPWSLSEHKYGENIAWGYNTFGDVLEAWYNEVSDYDFGHPVYQPGTGHFSQVVWRSSSKLGCAFNVKCEWSTWVCMYDPAGNIDDESWGSNVLPPSTAVAMPNAQPLAAAVLKPGVDGQAIVAAVLKPEYSDALARHNGYRQKHQVPALVWDDALAASAARWAAGCPSGHSGYAGVGENMAWGHSNLADAIDAWYDEVRLYDFNKPGWNTATGHFTALVWKSTTKLGCATNNACGWATYACQYQSPGNIIGVDWSQFVKPAVATAVSPSPAPRPPSPSPRPPAASPAPAMVRTSPTPLLQPSPSPSLVRRSPSPSPVVQASPAPAVKSSPLPVAVAPKTSDMQKVLELHNSYRRTHQAATLVWDEKLVVSAKKWADTCTFGVSRTAGVGEALGFGYRTFPDAVKGWYNQVSKYDYNNPGWTSGSGLFTQMVWRSTKAVGCAVNPSCNWAMYVCHYSPPGNMVGPSIDWSQQVRPAITTAAVPKPLLDEQAGVDAAAFEDQAWDAQDAQRVEDEDVLTAGVDPLNSAAPITAAVGFPDSLEPTHPDLVEALRRISLYRKRHQVPPLTWDEGLASQAAAFVADCPLKHSYIRNIGESLGWGFRSFTDTIDAWYNQVHSYHFNKPGWSILAGHFSQMVWKDTTKVGCAVNKQCTWDTFICQYSPPGNVVSADWSTQVLPALDDYPEDAQQLWKPTLLPGEAYYNPNRDAETPAASDDSSSSSTVQLYATPVPVTQLPQLGGNTPTMPVNPAATEPREPPESPVTQTEVLAVTPGPPTVTPGPATQVTPEVPSAAAPEQPFQPVPTMPADQMYPQQASNSAAGSSGSGSSTAPDGAAAPAAAAPSGGSSIAVPGLSAELQAALDLSNSYRGQHSSPDLIWDESIASQAAAYIAGCPTGHSQAKGFGENLAWGYDSMSAAVTAWYNEVNAYDFARGGFSGATGHFTQLVWRDTTKVGCAVNKACSMPTYTCQYTAPGNVMRVDWSKQVQPKTSTPTNPSKTAPTIPTQPMTIVPEPATPAWPQQQQQQQQQQQPATQSPAQTNWWETPKHQQQPSTPMEPTNPTPATPVPSKPTPTPAAPADGAAPAEYTVVFEVTNRYRAKHQVAALAWDEALATRSQQYADACPGGHSGDKGVGENLAWGYPSWQSTVAAWYSEVSSYSFSSPGVEWCHGPLHTAGVERHDQGRLWLQRALSHDHLRLPVLASRQRPRQRLVCTGLAGRLDHIMPGPKGYASLASASLASHLVQPPSCWFAPAGSACWPPGWLVYKGSRAAPRRPPDAGPAHGLAWHAA